MKKSAPKNKKIVLLISFIVALIFCQGRLVAQIDKSKFGEGAVEKEEQYPNNEGGKGTRTTVTDASGKLRQSRIQIVFESNRMVEGGKTKTFIRRETTFREYDCNERVIFESRKITENGKELKYSDATFHYNKWGDKIQTGGVKRETDKEGKTKTEKYDPIKKEWAMLSLSGDAEMALASLVPASDCPVSGPGHRFGIFVGPSYHREIYDGDGESFFGANVCLSFPLNQWVEFTADLAGYFKKDGALQVNKYFILGGANFYPIKSASIGMNVSFSIHGEAGVSVVRAKSGEMTYSKTAFTYAAGPSIDFGLGPSTRIGIRTDIGQRLVKDIHTTNLRASVGLVKEL